MGQQGEPEMERSAALGPTSRRALLTAGLGALAATVASALGRPLPVRADDEYMQVGQQYFTATKITEIENHANDVGVFAGVSLGAGTGLIGTSLGGIGIQGESVNSTGVRAVSSNGTGVLGTSNKAAGVSGASGSWHGVAGSSGSGYGVYGEANGSGAAAIGVHGTSVAGVGMLGKSRAADQPGSIGWSGGDSTGLQGFSNNNSANPPAPRAKTGVFGQATQDSASRGVLGVSTSGNGVRGEASTGVGVQGIATNAAGYAIRGSGRLRFDKVSGVATIAANSTSVTITPGTDVTSESFLLLTPKTNIGTRSVYFTTDATNNRVTIHISSKRTTATVIAWLLLS